MDLIERTWRNPWLLLACIVAAITAIALAVRSLPPEVDGREDFGASVQQEAAKYDAETAGVRSE